MMKFISKIHVLLSMFHRSQASRQMIDLEAYNDRSVWPEFNSNTKKTYILCQKIGIQVFVQFRCILFLLFLLLVQVHVENDLSNEIQVKLHSFQQWYCTTYRFLGRRIFWIREAVTAIRPEWRMRASRRTMTSSSTINLRIFTVLIRHKASNAHSAIGRPHHFALRISYIHEYVMRVIDDFIWQICEEFSVKNFIFYSMQLQRHYFLIPNLVPSSTCST